MNPETVSLLCQRLDGCGFTISLSTSSFWMQHNCIILSWLLLGEIHKNLQRNRNGLDWKMCKVTFLNYTKIIKILDEGHESVKNNIWAIRKMYGIRDQYLPTYLTVLVIMLTFRSFKVYVCLKYTWFTISVFAKSGDHECLYQIYLHQLLVCGVAFKDLFLGVFWLGRTCIDTVCLYPNLNSCLKLFISFWYMIGYFSWRVGVILHNSLCQECINVCLNGWMWQLLINYCKNLINWKAKSNWGGIRETIAGLRHTGIILHSQKQHLYTYTDLK